MNLDKGDYCRKIIVVKKEWQCFICVDYIYVFSRTAEMIVHG
jgi:hypothetical protein